MRKIANWKRLVALAIFGLWLEFQHSSSPSITTHQRRNSALAAPLHLPASKIPRLVICGTVQNFEPHLVKIEKTIARLLRSDHFVLLGMVWYENDSIDKTVHMLQSWSKYGNVTVLSEHSRPSEKRTSRLARGRNRLWSEVSDRFGDAVNYVLMMDMDDVNWHLAHVEQCLNLPSDWGVCCCNSYKVYYDLWALRTFDNWMPCDLKSTHCVLPSHRRKPFRHISAREEPINVKSCFGGAALYKFGPQLKSYLQRKQQPFYQGVDDEGKETCEHVSFHLDLRLSTNLSLYIQPKFLNDGPSDERMLYFGGVKKRFEREYTQSLSDPALRQFYRTMEVA